MNLTNKDFLAVDIETYDPNLKELRSDGSIRKDGRILCVGVYNPHFSKVFDFDYPEQIAECKELIEFDCPKIFHNGVYDTAWLCCGYNFNIHGTIHDTMTRATFIDEYQDLDLDSCCKKLGLKGKNKNETIEAWYNDWQASMKDAAKGFKKGYLVDNEVYSPESGATYKLSDAEIDYLVNGTYKNSLWQNALVVWNDPTGRELMKKYNLQDCIATYNLFFKQEPLMKGSEDAYQVECDLYYLLIKMRRQGVRIDLKRLVDLTDKVDADKKAAEKHLTNMYGITGSMIASPKQLGIRMNELGIHSPIITSKGAESWSAEALARIQHPVVNKILEYKNYEAISDKYLHGALYNSIINDRIHCTFSPNKREEGGTITGRFASSGPNLQNIPAKNKGHGTDYSQDMRALFIPEEGCMMGAFDYSQIEYLLLAHYAVGPQAEEFRAQANAGVDFHTVAMSMTGLTYRPLVKTYNYGVIYGMGWKTSMEKNYTMFEKLAAEQGLDIETFAKKTYDNYHAKMPVIHDTMTWCQNLAKMQGYVECLGGRKQHKPRAYYDPALGKINDFIYKMLNKLIQGSAAYILKYALRDTLKAGIFDVCSMHITVHDENVISIPFNKEGTEAAAEMKHIMDMSFHDQLLVPMKACGEVGPNWGYWSGDIWEEMLKGNFNPELFNKDYKETH